mgnify:CR=1 FL=1
MAFIATLHRSEVTPKFFIAIKHVVVPMLVTGRDDRCWHGSIGRWDGLAAFRCIDVFMDDAFAPVVESDSERAINGSFTFVGRKHVQDITEHVGNLISIHWSIRGKDVGFVFAAGLAP